MLVVLLVPARRTWLQAYGLRLSACLPGTSSREVCIPFSASNSTLRLHPGGRGPCSYCINNLQINVHLGVTCWVNDQFSVTLACPGTSCLYPVGLHTTWSSYFTPATLLRLPPRCCYGQLATCMHGAYTVVLAPWRTCACHVGGLPACQLLPSTCPSGHALQQKKQHVAKRSKLRLHGNVVGGPAHPPPTTSSRLPWPHGPLHSAHCIHPSI
jgi:hypothetical protein